MLNISSRQYRTISYGVFAVLAVLIVTTFRDYGITWDEELQSQYGLAVVDYYRSFFHDHRYKDIFNLYIYGGMFDGMASIIDQYTPFSLYETRHLLNGLVGLLGLWGTWRVGRLIGGGAVGLMALVMLALTPMYYGHMFNNPKDIPFAAGVIWSLYYMGRCFAAEQHVSPRLIVKLGVVLGLMLGVRVGGVMLPAFWVGVFGWDVLRANDKTKMFGKFVRIVIPVGIISFIVMLICWPWAQQHPILNPLRALSEFSNFPQDVEVLLDGVTYRSTQLPWYYVPLYFSVQLPEFLLLLLGAAVFTSPFVWQSLNPARRKLLVTMLLMGLFPVIYAVIRHPALYDAVRHFIFVLPIACVVAAMTARHLCLWAVAEFERKSSKILIASGIGVIVLLTTVAQIAVMTRLHPYEYIYVNNFWGGVAGANNRYALDYWGSSFKEAAEKLQDYVAKEGGVPQGKIYKIAICGPWSSAMIYLPPDYEAVIANEPAEFFIATTRWQCQNMRPGKEIIEIDRMGAPLAVVKDLRNGYEYYDGNRKR